MPFADYIIRIRTGIVCLDMHGHGLSNPQGQGIQKFNETKKKREKIRESSLFQRCLPFPIPQHTVFLIVPFVSLCGKTMAPLSSSESGVGGALSKSAYTKARSPSMVVNVEGNLWK